MGQNFDASKAGDLDLTILFDLSGEGGGQWHATIADGSIGLRERRRRKPIRNFVHGRG